MSGDADPFIVLAATPRQWAAALHAHATDHGGVIVRATVLTEGDARAEDCDVLVVDDITSFLTPALVAACHESGRAVLGVYDPEDGQGKGELVEMDVDALVAADAPPEELVDTIRGLALANTLRAAPSRSPAPGAAPEPARARTVAVTGPPGGVGVTEVAIELAASIASTGRRTVLIDVDEVAPAHAQRLGLALHPNVLGAIDAVRRGADLTLGLHPLTSRYPLAALPGMASPADWGNVPRDAVPQLVEGLAGCSDRLVIDLGHCPDRIDGPNGARFGHGLSLAGTCDALVVVTVPTPVAIARTIALCSRLASQHVTIHLALNRVGRDRFTREEAIAELRRGLGISTVHVLAEDPRVASAAWQGQRVGRGRFSRGVAELVRAVMGGTV